MRDFLPPESLSVQPFILGNGESSEDCPYPAVAGVRDCPLNGPTHTRANDLNYKGRAGCPIAKVKLRGPETARTEAGVSAGGLGDGDGSVLAEFEFQTVDSRLLALPVPPPFPSLLSPRLELPCPPLSRLLETKSSDCLEPHILPTLFTFLVLGAEY